MPKSPIDSFFDAADKVLDGVESALGKERTEEEVIDLESSDGGKTFAAHDESHHRYKWIAVREIHGVVWHAFLLDMAPEGRCLCDRAWPSGLLMQGEMSGRGSVLACIPCLLATTGMQWSRRALEP